jgi:hypothetical protein
LPQTGLIFGTQSNPRGVRIYRCIDEICYNRYFWFKNSCVELRGEGKFLWLPSSEAVSGEKLEFCYTEPPTEITRDELLRAVIMFHAFCADGREYARKFTGYRQILAEHPFDDKESVHKYVTMCEGYCGSDDADTLDQHSLDVEGCTETPEEMADSKAHVEFDDDLPAGGYVWLLFGSFTLKTEYRTWTLYQETSEEEWYS